MELKIAEKTVKEQHEQLQKTLFEIAELRDSDEERLIDLNLSNEHLRIAIDEADTSNRAIRKIFSRGILPTTNMAAAYSADSDTHSPAPEVKFSLYLKAVIASMVSVFQYGIISESYLSRPKCFLISISK